MAFQDLIFNLKGNASGAVEAFKQASEQAKNLQKNIAGAGQDIASFGKQATAMASPLIALGAVALKASSDVNSGLRQIRIGTGETGDALQSLNKDFAAVFGSIPTGAKEAGQAIAVLHSRTGEVGEGLQNLARQELELARITGGDLASQINNTTRLFGDWSIANKDAGAALDTVFRASQNTSVSVDRLSQLMVQFGAPMRSLGFDFEQAAALLGKFEKEGVNTELVMGSLRIALGKMAKEGVKDPAEAFKILTERIKGAKDEGTATTLAFELFGRRAGVDMAKAIREGRFEIDELTNRIKTSKDTILGASEDTRTFGESMQILKNKVELALAPLGKAISSVMKDMLPAIESAVSWLSNLAKAFTELDPATKKMIGGIIAVFSMIGPFTFLIGKVTAALSMLAGPLGIGLVIGALGYLVISGSDAATGIANMWNKMSGDTAAASADMVAKIRMVTDALQIAGAAYIGFRVGGPVGAVVGGAVGVATLPKNPTPVIGVQPGTSNYSQSALDRFNKEAQGLTDAAKSKSIWMQKFGHEAGTAYVTAAAEGVKQNAHIPDAATQKAIEGLAGGGGKKARAGGGSVGKAFIDGFSDGLDGFKKAVAKVDSSDLGLLFDKLSKKARAGAEETNAALRVVTAGINEFAQSQGVNAKLTEAQVGTMAKGTREALEKHALAYKTAQDEINRIQVEGLANNKIVFAATQAEIDKMSAGAKKSFAELGGVFKIMPPALKLVSVSAEEEGKATSTAMSDMARQSRASFDAFQERANRLAVELPKPFDAASIAIIGAADKMKRALGEDESLLVMKAQLDIRRSIESTISTIEEYGETLGLTGRALDAYVEDTIRKMPQFAGAHKEALEKVIEEHRRAAVRLPGIWEDVFSKVSSRAKSWASDLIGVVETLPGKFGDAGRKILSSLDSWLTFANQLLAIFHRLNANIPGSLSDMLDKVIGIFKSKGQQAKQVSNDVWNEIFLGNWKPKLTEQQQKLESILDEVLGPVQKSNGRAANSATGLGNFLGGKLMEGLSAALAGTAAIVGAHQIGGIQGAISGALGGALAGAKLGSMIAPGLGTAIGAIAGGALGFFSGIFGHKSALQKAQEAAALQQAKDAIKISQQSVLKALEETKQSLLETTEKARQLLENLRFYDRVGKPAIKDFFKDLTLFMKMLAQEATKWASFAKGDIKAASEQLGAGVQLIGALFPILSGIGTYFKLGQGQIETFFSDVEPFFQRLGEFVSSIPKKIQKAIGKFGDRTESGIGILSPLLDFIKGALEVKPVPDSAFDVVDNTLTRMVERLGRIGENFKKSFLKTVAFVGENLSPGVSLLGSILSVIKDALGAQAPSDTDLDNIFSALMSMSTRMIAFANELSTEGLQKASAIATAITPVASALKTWAEASAVIRGYTSIAAETWNHISDDFFHAIDLLALLKGGVDTFQSLTDYIASHIQSAGDSLKTALVNFANAINVAASAINGAINLQSGLATASAGASAFAAGAFGASSFTPSFAGASAGGGTYIDKYYDIEGSLIVDSELDKRVHQANQRNKQRYGKKGDDS